MNKPEGEHNQKDETDHLALEDERLARLSTPLIPKEDIGRQLPSSGFGVLGGSAIGEITTWILPIVRAVRGKGPVTDSHKAAVASEESLFAPIRTFIKNSGIYALASIGAPLISLVLAPFLTHALPHADFGALVVLNTVIALTAGITQFGLNNAFFRAYSMDYESQRDRLGVLSTVVVLLSLITAPITIAAMITAPWLADLLFKNASFSGPVRLAALVVLMQNLTVPGFSWLRAESRALLFSILSIANLLIALGGNVILVGILHMGISGSLLATGGGYAIVVACTLPVVLLRAGLRLRFDIAWNLVSFGLPLVSNFVSIWILQLSDRYLLSRLASLTQTASYAVAYSLGGALGVVILSPFSLAWPATMFAIAKRDDAKQIFRQVFHWYSIVLLFATFALSITGIGVLNILFPPAYHSAAPVIPIVAISLMFYGLCDFFMVGVGIRRKTWIAVIFTTFAALVNVGLNLILIPRYGSMGAAMSTLLAYTLLALIAYIASHWIYPIRFEVGQFLIALLIGIALYVGSGFLTRTQDIFRAGIIYIGALALYGGCLVFLGKLPGRNYNQTYQQS